MRQKPLLLVPARSVSLNMTSSSKGTWLLHTERRSATVTLAVSTHEIITDLLVTPGWQFRVPPQYLHTIWPP